MSVAAAVVAGLSFTALLCWPSAVADARRRRGGGVVDTGRVTGLPLPALGPDLVMDLVVCGLRAGLPVGDALASAARAAGGSADDRGLEPGRRARLTGGGYLNAVVGRLRLGVPGSVAWGVPPADYAGLARAMILADLSGAPAASVVARAAADLRVARRERAELAAARLGVRLVLPLGLAVLPGFVLLAVVPIVLGLAASLLQGVG